MVRGEEGMVVIYSTEDGDRPKALAYYFFPGRCNASLWRQFLSHRMSLESQNLDPFITLVV